MLHQFQLKHHTRIDSFARHSTKLLPVILIIQFKLVGLICERSTVSESKQQFQFIVRVTIPSVYIAHRPNSHIPLTNDLFNTYSKLPFIQFTSKNKTKIQAESEKRAKHQITSSAAIPPTYRDKPTVLWANYAQMCSAPHSLCTTTAASHRPRTIIVRIWPLSFM